MSDAQTLSVYASQTDAYRDMMHREAARDEVIGPFIAALPAKARVLDLGCGPGTFAHMMADTGLRVDAWDAVPEMVAYAGGHHGVTARQALFSELDAEALYDGIWAYFSLLHAPRDALPDHLRAIRRALVPGGLALIAVKRGNGGGRDSLGRHYEYYERPELEGYLRDAGLSPQRHWTGVAPGLSGHPAGWVAILSHA